PPPPSRHPRLHRRTHQRHRLRHQTRSPQDQATIRPATGHGRDGTSGQRGPNDTRRQRTSRDRERAEAVIERRQTRAGVRYEVRMRGVDGKERSRTFRTRKDAERYERAQHTAIDHGLWVDPRSGRVTLTAWASEWQRTVVHLRPTTRRIYDANLRNHI